MTAGVLAHADRAREPMRGNDGRLAQFAVALVCLAIGACSGGEGSAAEAQEVARAATQPAPEGITVERITASIAPSSGARRHPLTIVRFDLSLYRPRLFTARAHGGSRPLDRWVREQHLVAGINAAMYEPDGRATGLMVREGHAESPVDDPRFGGFLAFDGIAGAAPTSAHVEMFGRDCAGFDLSAIRARYATVISNFRMLDCAGDAIAWVDPDRYSAAAIGMDREGRLVLVHSRTPYRTRELSEMLAADELGLSQLVYVEGGPEATLIVDAGSAHVREVGLRRDLPPGIEGDDSLWSLPNIIGIERIDPQAD